MLPRALDQLNQERQKQRKEKKEKDLLYSCVWKAVTLKICCMVTP